nr:PadR family transcriptional regulator [Nocardia bovistercoris]
MVEGPMHRYEIAAKLRGRGKDRDMAIKWGSLYTVVRNMEKAGFLEIIGSERDGTRPERVIYRITPEGRAEFSDWTRELIATPEPELDRFTAGLSVVGALPPDEVIDALGVRIAALEATVAAGNAEFAAIRSTGLPRLFLIETEYGMARLGAELDWARSWRAELIDGTFPDLELWRRFHADGVDPAEVFEMFEGGSAPESESKRPSAD